MQDRKEVFSYERLPWYGRLSLKIGNQAILNNMVEGNWLDVLCGYAAILQRSQIENPKFTQFYCLDHKLDKKLPSKKFKLTETYIEKKLPYKNNTFENITIVNGLEHLWNAQDIVSEMYRVLKPGGVLQIIVPSWFGKPILEFIAFRLKHTQAMIEMNDHKMYYDVKDLWPLLAKAGFEPKNITVNTIKFNCSTHGIAKK